jgi:predicted site-specific integrase-resolvase
MNLAVWAKRDGVARLTAYRWFRAGLLLAPARKVARLIFVDDPSAPAEPCSRTVMYARVSSADQKADLDRQRARVRAWATTQQIPVDKVASEFGSALNGHRRRFLTLLGDPSVQHDPVRDMTEILTRMCASLCGKRSARNCAKRAVAAAAAVDRQAA